MLISDIKDPRLRARILRTLNDADQLKQAIVKECPTPRKKRIRQDPKPLMNKLEEEALEYLKEEDRKARTEFVFRPHALVLKLANGCVYNVDIVGFGNPRPRICAWEVKGKHAWDDSIVKLKVAAHEWPTIEFYLMWKDNGQWITQHVLP